MKVPKSVFRQLVPELPFRLKLFPVVVILILGIAWAITRPPSAPAPKTAATARAKVTSVAASANQGLDQRHRRTPSASSSTRTTPSGGSSPTSGGGVPAPGGAPPTNGTTPGSSPGDGSTPDGSTPGGAAGDPPPTCWYPQLPDEAKVTIGLVLRGGPFPYRKDGAVFENYDHPLPPHERGWYHEYTVRTPGASTRGTRRIVTGGGTRTQPGDWYYTGDHYQTFCTVAGVP